MNDNKDKLRDLFDNIKLDSPSMSFENKLMQQIYAEQRLIEKKRNRLSKLTMILGSITVIIIPIVVLYFMGWPILDEIKSIGQYFNSSSAIKYNTDSNLISIPIICFILLIVDLIIRKHLMNKKKDNDIF